MIKVALMPGHEAALWKDALSATPEVELGYFVGGEADAGPLAATTRVVPRVEAALDDAAIDAVIFGAGASVEALDAAAKSGKALLIARSSFRDRRRFEVFAERLEAQSAPCFAGFFQRFDEGLTRLKSELGSGAIGRIESVSISTREPRLSAAREAVPESILDDLDLARWLLGEEPVEVHAVAGTPIERPIEAGFDVLQVTLRTASGRLAQLTHHARTILDAERRVEVVGTKGGISVINPEADALTLWMEDGAHQERLYERLQARASAARARALAHFARAIADPEQPMLTSPFDVRQALSIRDAVIDSARSRRIVRLR